MRADVDIDRVELRGFFAGVLQFAALTSREAGGASGAGGEVELGRQTGLL